jgi:ankyrin repeat protein
MRYVQVIVLLLSLAVTFPALAKLNPNLVQAVVMNNTRIMNFLLDGGEDINEKNEYGETILMIAVDKGRLKMVRTLIARGADVNAKDKEGKSVLKRAKQKGNEQIIQMLKDAGAKG